MGEKPLDFLRILIPALLYLVQNTLLYVALSNLSAPLFQVTYQGKLLTTALVSVVLLNRKYNFRQWICLSTLGLGVAVVVLGETSSKKNNEVEELNAQDMTVGLVAVTIACLSSALAGVYFEKVLKKKSEPAPNTAHGDSAQQQQQPRQPPSLWMRNIQMAFFSVCTACVRLFMERSRGDDEIEEKSFLHGFNSWVWLLVGLQAGGGLLVAAVMKYADNVLKGMATGVAVCFTSVCSLVFFGTPLQASFSVGAAIILTSVYFFANDFNFGKSKSSSMLIARKQSELNEKDAIMKPMLPK